MSSFDTIPHGDLMQSVARRTADRDVLRLIKMWLTAPVEEQGANGRWEIVGGLILVALSIKF
jgi:RNA-directed DNA polymerase